MEDKVKLRVLVNGKKTLVDSPVIWLGRGQTTVSDVCNNGKWAGILLSTTKESVDIGEEFTGDLAPIVAIVSEDMQSLDVVIRALQRARKAYHQDQASKGY